MTNFETRTYSDSNTLLNLYRTANTVTLRVGRFGIRYRLKPAAPRPAWVKQPDPWQPVQMPDLGAEERWANRIARQIEACHRTLCPHAA